MFADVVLHKMPQKISLITRPETAFELPYSEGYQLYSAILGIMREADASISKHTHDSPISSISISPLDGKFRRCDRLKHKVVDPAEKYEMKIGITDPMEVEIFRSIIQPLILKERNLSLEKGELRVEEVSSSTTSFEDLVRSAGDLKEPFIDFEFRSPACIQYRNSKVYEMFPHREAVFHSLLSKWNAICPEKLKMAIERDDMARHLVEKPLAYETHSVVVNTFVDKKKGHARPKIMQGFTGHCQYIFTRDAPEGVRNGIVALARFAEYSGLGSAVARGCGAVKVTMGEAR
jgi:CRISPR-associated endoribonuclease Cas6